MKSYLNYKKDIHFIFIGYKVLWVSKKRKNLVYDSFIPKEAELKSFFFTRLTKSRKFGSRNTRLPIFIHIHLLYFEKRA